MIGLESRVQRQKAGLSQAKLSELSGISQHLLSAYELGKEIPKQRILDRIRESLSDRNAIALLASRAKRYQNHCYSTVPKVQQRIDRARATPGNKPYRQVLEEIWRLHQGEKCSLSALSLFSGCGGFSLGFSAAGFAIKGHLEVDKKIEATYKLNFPKSLSLGGDITSIASEHLREVAARTESVDVLIGGPPCQGFSLSGKRDASDARNDLFRHYMRFLHVFQPKVALLENVRLLTSMRDATGGSVKEAVCKSFLEHGYRVQCFEINAKSYGVPQHRERVIFVAVKHDLCIKPELSLPTHVKSANLFIEEMPYRTFGDACSDLPFIESGDTSDDPLHVAVKHPSHIIDWLWDVPEGSSAHDNADRSKRPPSGYNTTYKRQVWSEPAATVQTTFGMISGCRNVHPIATRSLSVREAARIQSFPDNFRFVGNVGTIRTGIGNAVPPLLAYQVALHLREQLQSL